MLSSKPKSGIFETSNNKTTPPATRSGVSDSSNNKTSPATPRDSKLGRAGSTKSDSSSPSPLQSLRLSIDRSPKSVDSKPSSDRRPLRLNTPPDKQLRLSKGSELQVQLGVVQEDLKKAREQLALTEQEKARALEELNDSKRLADEANEKLKEALVAKRRAEESTEIEKFRADELEQAGIEAADKREEEWQKELEKVRNQHALDLEALLTTTQELQRVKHELAMSTDAKNAALSHADDAMKIAEINGEKVLFLTGEVSRLKALLDSEMENMSNEVKNVKAAEEKLVEMETLVEGLKAGATDAKRAEADACELVDVWKRKAEALEVKLEEATVSENKTAELVKELDSQVDALREDRARAEAAEEKLAETEALVEGLRTELSDSKREESEWKRKAELLQVHVEVADHTKSEIIEQVNILDTELDAMKHELERAKVAEDKLSEMEALVGELRTELNDAKMAQTDACELLDEWKGKAELLQVEVEETNLSKESLLDTLTSVSRQLEDSNALLKDAESNIASLKETIEALEVVVTRHKAELDESERHLDAAQHEAFELESAVQSMSEERTKLITELEDSKDEEDKAKMAMEGLASALHEVSSEAREAQERLLVKQVESENAHKQIEELKSALKSTEGRYEVLLKTSRSEWDEKEVNFLSYIKKMEEELASLKVEMEKLETEMMIRLREANSGAEAAKAESLQLKERLLDKENELQSITQENDDLRSREAATFEEARDLAKENRGSEFQEKNDENELEKPEPEETCCREGNDEEEEAVESEARKWKSSRVMDEDFSSERKLEAPVRDHEFGAEIDTSSFGRIYGLPSSDKTDNVEVQHEKKKNDLLNKLKHMLKKKKKKSRLTESI